MQPYQKATKEIRRQGELPLQIAKNAASLGSAAATAGGAAYLSKGVISKVLPFLSNYLPEDLAIKGLNKIDPRYGSFIQKAMGAGKSFDEVKEFIGSKIEGSGSGKKAPDKRNIIEQYSPELFQFLQGEIQKGRQPIEAGALAQSQKSFQSIIKKMSDDHKAPFSSILESIFGSAQQPQQTQKNQQNPQSGNGDDALLAALDKILKM